MERRTERPTVPLRYIRRSPLAWRTSKPPATHPPLLRNPASPGHLKETAQLQKRNIHGKEQESRPQQVGRRESKQDRKRLAYWTNRTSFRHHGRSRYARTKMENKQRSFVEATSRGVPPHTKMSRDKKQNENPQQRMIATNQRSTYTATPRKATLAASAEESLGRAPGTTKGTPSLKGSLTILA